MGLNDQTAAGAESGRFSLDPNVMLKGGDFARKTVELPRRLKRLISVCTDCVMIPLAFGLRSV